MTMADAAARLSHPAYRADIDGLRAVAVVPVVAFHAFPGWMKGGFIGVDVFFVISGFLISTIIFENLERGSFSFAAFYARRIRRIFPALLVVLSACLVGGWLLLLPDELNQLGTHVAAGAGFVANFAFWGEAGYFDNSADTKPLLHLWSLGIEEQFYLVWPCLAWLAWKCRFHPVILAAALALASFQLNLQGVRQDAVATFYAPQTRFWELLCGSVLAWLAMSRRAAAAAAPAAGARPPAAQVPWVARHARQALPQLLSVLGALLLAYGLATITKDTDFPGAWALVPAVGAALVIAAGPGAWINRHLLSSRLAVWLGLISFPLYLWHWPLLSFARIVESGAASRDLRIAAVALAVLLAWLTARHIERPFRAGDDGAWRRVAALSGAMVAVGLAGFAVSRMDFSATHGFHQLAIKRTGFEHALGAALTWYRGKDDWLFLGNAFDNNVAKLKRAVEPDDAQVQGTKAALARVAEAAQQHRTPVVLVVGPDKSTIYPEFLPDAITPAPVRYSAVFVDALRTVPHLLVHDPAPELLALKATEGILYRRTDTHWNNKGAFLVFAGLARRLDLPVPAVDFRHGATRAGDLLRLSNLKNFPLRPDDHWEVVWKQQPAWTEQTVQDDDRTGPGNAVVVRNGKPLSDKVVWVVGDSFVGALKQYFNATFREVRYLGHWERRLRTLPQELARAGQKPDLIVVVRVERSF